MMLKLTGYYYLFHKCFIFHFKLPQYFFLFIYYKYSSICDVTILSFYIIEINL